jgi:subtilisin family serine protease
MKRLLIIRLLVLLLLLSIVVVITSQTIQLQHTRIETNEEKNVLHSLIVNGRVNKYHVRSSVTSNSKQFLIQMKQRSYWKKVEQLLGIQIHSEQFIPPNTFVLYETEDTLASRLRQSEEDVSKYIQWIGYMEGGYKTNLKFPKKHKRMITPEDKIIIDLVVTLVAPRAPQVIQSVTNSLHKYKMKNVVTFEEYNGGSRIGIKVDSSVVHRVIDILKVLEEVHWIERTLPSIPLNHATNIIIQSNGTIPSNEQDQKPIWKHGITGSGEIVAVADTGLDWNSNCFFFDPDHEPKLNRISEQHRKIYGYYFEPGEGDFEDDVYGHGTHVCGALAGSLPNNELEEHNPIGKYSGVAKDARIFFQDIQVTDTNYLSIPTNIYDKIFGQAYEHGIRIHSNSWGQVSNYDCVFDCKCIRYTDDEDGKAGTPVSNELCISKYGMECCKVSNIYGLLSHEIDRFTHDHEDMVIVFPSGNTGQYTTHGTVSSPATSKNCIAVGASNTLTNGFVDSTNYLDYSEILQENGLESTVQCCDKGIFECCPQMIQQEYLRQSAVYNNNNMADFSSRAPTLDGRLKPDIVAPGFVVISANSNGYMDDYQCGAKMGNNSTTLGVMAGTSMSVPVVSGACALIRNYYKSIKLYDNPSGPLVKATLIHSGTDQSGYVSNGKHRVKIPVSPNLFNGFGVVSLSSVLRFEDSQFELYTYDRVQIGEGDFHEYYFEVLDNSAASIKATMTWYDPPASIAAKQVLVNDIDLYIQYNTTNSERILVFGNDVTSGDRVNTVEQVKLIEIPPAAQIRIVVKGVAISQAQNYALVVTGTHIRKSQEPMIYTRSCGSFQCPNDNSCCHNMAGDLKEQCYSTVTHHCIPDTYRMSWNNCLCAKSDGCCNNVCYDQNVYKCVNGQVQLKFGTFSNSKV